MRSRAIKDEIYGVVARTAGICFGVALAFGAAAASDGSTCFDVIEQDYAWDDGGFHWTSMPDRCPGSPQPASASERKWGGSVQIRASGRDATIVEETYAWLPKRKGSDAGCPRYFRSVTHRTRIAKEGVLYDTTQVDDEPAQSSQRPLKPHEIISIPNIQTAPRLSDAYAQTIGSDTIAGQPCQRVVPKPGAPGAGTIEMCVFIAPLNCPRGRYLQPLELFIKGPDGQTLWHGRTSTLQVSGRGNE